MTNPVPSATSDDQPNWYDPQAAARAISDAIGVDETQVPFITPVPAGATMRGLLLSGGGAMGVYEAGSVQALAINGFNFEAIVGISIGSINSAAFAEYLTRADAAHRPVSPAQAEFLKRILYFWEYVDQSKITDLDSAPVVPLLNDLQRLYVALSSLSRFYVANYNPDLNQNQPPLVESSSPNPITRVRFWLRWLGAYIKRVLSWLEIFILLLPSVLFSVLVLPFELLLRLLGRNVQVGDLYIAIIEGVAAKLRPKPKPLTPPSLSQPDDFATLLRGIVVEAFLSYNKVDDPSDKKMKSLFGNQRLTHILSNFPLLRVYTDPLDITSAVIAVAQTPAIDPQRTFAVYRDALGGTELRFPRTSVRTGNAEVSAAYTLYEALDTTLHRLDSVLPQPLNLSPTNGASRQVLLELVLHIESQLTLNMMQGKPLVKPDKLVVGNPNVVHGVMASAAFPAAFPPVNLNEIYPIAGGDPDNIALKAICRLASLYSRTSPPQQPEQVELAFAQQNIATASSQQVRADIITRLSSSLPARDNDLLTFVDAILAFQPDTPAPARDPALVRAQLAACIAAVWYYSYPIWDEEGEFTPNRKPFVEQYFDGGFGDPTPIGNAIDALTARATNLDPTARAATHYVFFVHLGNDTLGVRDIGQEAEVRQSVGTLSTTTLQDYLFYEYLLRSSSVAERDRYLSNTRVTNRIHDYITRLHALNSNLNELLIKVINVYPSVKLNSPGAFDQRLGYRRGNQRQQIAAGCSDMMLTLWTARQGNEPAILPTEVADRIQRWLVPGFATAQPVGPPTPQLFCRNGACMYRDQCPLARNVTPRDPADTLISDYKIDADTSPDPPPA